MENASLPRASILDAWSEQDWDNGIQIDKLQELDTIAVRTAYSLYEITILNGRKGDVLIRGGKFFPVFTNVHLAGSTFGGSFLKMRGIYVGMSMEIVPQPTEMVSEVVYDPTTGKPEFLLGYKRIVTSPVQSIGMVV